MDKEVQVKSNTEEAKNEIKMDEKIIVTSIAPWTTGFRRILTIGDIQIQPNGNVRISREEVIAQAQSGNKLLTGIDGMGSHATLYIEDEWVRRELEFDTDEKKQIVVNKKLVKEMFDLKTFPSFKKAVETNIITRAEKFYLLNIIKTLKVDSYERISFCEQYCGSKINP